MMWKGDIGNIPQLKRQKLEMWANAQRDGRPAEYRWRPLFNTAKFGWCSVLEYRAVTLPGREPIEISRGAANYRIDLSR